MKWRQWLWVFLFMKQFWFPPSWSHFLQAIGRWFFFYALHCFLGVSPEYICCIIWFQPLNVILSSSSINKTLPWWGMPRNSSLLLMCCVGCFPFLKSFNFSLWLLGIMLWSGIRKCERCRCGCYLNTLVQKSGHRCGHWRVHNHCSWGDCLWRSKAEV